MFPPVVTQTRGRRLNKITLNTSTPHTVLRHARLVLVGERMRENGIHHPYLLVSYLTDKVGPILTGWVVPG